MNRLLAAQLAALALLVIIGGMVGWVFVNVFDRFPQPAPECADRVALAFTEPAERIDTYNDCLTDSFKARYPLAETWYDDLSTRWNWPGAEVPLTREFVQYTRTGVANIFYVTTIQTPTGLKGTSVRMFTSPAGKVDFILM